MTREELGTYGASQKDIDTVVGALRKFGLKVVSTDATTRSVRLSGTVAAMEDAFLVRLFNYEHESGAYRGRVGQVHVPAKLENIVEGVFGLDDRRVARRRRQPARDNHGAKAATGIASWYRPAQLAKHYNFPAGDGAGQTVGILEFGGGYFDSDLQSFCTIAGTSKPQVTVVSTDGVGTKAKDGAEGEVMLDAEIVAGACPKAAIVLYFAHWSEHGWISALDAVIQDKAHDPGVVSVSWGFAEDVSIWTGQAMKQVNETLKEAALLGITVCIASGDDGSSDGVLDGQAHADFPGSSPYVLCVGGTTITAKGSDIVWKEGDGLRQDHGGSTGGGVSLVFDRPAWQSKVTVKQINPGGKDGRCLPDVAANADWDASPYLLVVDGIPEGNGGTSAATPLWASLITLINATRPAGKRVGYLTPVLYQPASGKSGSTIGALGCKDIKSGNNTTDLLGGYRSKAGYDAVTGWGTPNGQKLASLLP